MSHPLVLVLGGTAERYGTTKKFFWAARLDAAGMDPTR